ncbi:uncharacterized protein LOC106097618 isoform X5 [Oreochromis niloticus]|uniref:uncharacterized protein LOC106097618 isoform X5 n=1 Tax=Oreochromis niloticus TaxID=8128 RepID=UPI000DF11187|nr:uncharacterized protein LOC106097618 isoform X5 [Oreochromis niloticus]
MDAFDDAILSVLQAANIDYEALRSFTRDDLKDLFPGHENFFRRKKLWNFIIQQVTIYTKLYKRLQNMKSPRRKQGSMLQRGRPRKIIFSSDNLDNGTEGDLSGEASGSSDYTILDLSKDNSNAEKASKFHLHSTVPTQSNNNTLASPLLSKSASCSAPRAAIGPPTPDDDVADHDSLKMQPRHYKTLSNMYRKPNAKPNQSDVAQILDLEFEARQAFIDADVTREEDRPTKIFEAYLCFKDIRNVSLATFN